MNTIIERYNELTLDTCYIPRHEPADIELEDRMINLAYLFNKAKNKYYRTLELDWYTDHDREISRMALERIQRWCCKTAIALHEKYHKYNF